MSNTVRKINSNNISLTGVRALLLIGLLMVKPRSFNEIKEIFIDFKIIDKNSSDDILRIDLNTIKLMGCQISRSSASTNFKYKLIKHPFELKITDQELNILKKVYSLVRAEADLETIIDYHNLFEKIALHICNEQAKEALLGISILKYYKYDLIQELIKDCKLKNIVSLVYKKNNVAKISSREVLAQKIVFKNDKVYLYGHDIEKNTPIILNLRRLKSIISRRKLDKNIDIKETKIKFILKNLKKDDLEINEDVISETNNGYIIEGVYHNDFVAIQRMLSFGARCIVLEPLDFRNIIIEKIKEMRDTYGC